MAVDIQREHQAGVLVARISGRLDNESAADFELFVQETVAGGERHLLLDLSHLDYMSNAGARALATLSKSMNTPTSSLRVAGLQANVRQILDAAGVSALLDIHASERVALANHPAAQADSLGKHVLEILGVQASQPAPADARISKLAESAFDLLSGQQHHNRAAKAIAQGTQVMRRVSPADAAAAGRAPPAPVTARRPAALPWWKRLFGIKR